METDGTDFKDKEMRQGSRTHSHNTLIKVYTHLLNYLNGGIT